MNKKLTDIGFISKATGFVGEVLCVLEENFELPPTTHFLFLKLEGRPVPFFIEKKSENSSHLILKFEDVNDEETAKKLSGQHLFIETEKLDETKSELSWHDLAGFAAEDKTYGPLGIIHSVEEYPEQMLARCIVNNKEVLFPLSHDFIIELNEEKKIILLDLPLGLLDIYLGNQS